MKRLIRIAVLALIMGAASQAMGQFYVGGAVGFGYVGKNNKVTETIGSSTITVETSASGFDLTFCPDAGYAISDQLLVGGQLQLHYGKLGSKLGENSHEMSTTGFGFMPYAQYTFMNVKGFGLYLRGQLPINKYSEKEKTTKGSTTTEKEGPSNFFFGLEVAPGISYKLNSHITLFAGLNFLRVGFGHSSQTDETEKDTKGVRSVNRFYFGGDASGAAAWKDHSTAINLGMTWTF